jgi:glycosyltransferase involved in cell wall biosynthesis
MRGGVSDYTALLASALADAGCEVHVWCLAPGATVSDARVHLHAGTGFDRKSLAQFERELSTYSSARTLLVQYVPHAFGMRAMNVRFCLLMRGLARTGEDVRAMFHEPFYPFGRGARGNVIAVVNRLMATLLLRAATRVYVSVPAWARLLAPFARGSVNESMTWLPIPSTIPRVRDGAAVSSLRARLAGADAQIVTHFGTYGELVRPLLSDSAVRVLDMNPRALIVLLGEGGPRFRDVLIASRPDLGARIKAPGYLDAESVSMHLQASDVALFPFIDGASTRRTTLMAALANGVATVTTMGRFSEPLWPAAGAVELAPVGDGHAIASKVNAVLQDDARRKQLGERALQLYGERFAMRHTLVALLGVSTATARAGGSA